MVETGFGPGMVHAETYSSQSLPGCRAPSVWRTLRVARNDGVSDLLEELLDPLLHIIPILSGAAMEGGLSIGQLEDDAHEQTQL